MTTARSFGRKFQQFRNRNGLSTEDVGTRLKRSPKTISAWEVGRGAPKLEELPVICEMFNVRLCDFYDESIEDCDRVIETDQEYRLIDLYRQLNDLGKARLYEYAGNLAALERYTEKKGGDAIAV